ncbi:MAG: hypothetical protein H6982_15920 [Chromatiales bacterium]|nr:hypothetical protein [Chromatiales bacterium]
MSTPPIEHAAAGVSVLPLAPPARRPLTAALDLTQAVVYWGLLAFGILAPFLGVAFALLRQ